MMRANTLHQRYTDDEESDDDERSGDELSHLPSYLRKNRTLNSLKACSMQMNEDQLEKLIDALTRTEVRYMDLRNNPACFRRPRPVDDRLGSLFIRLDQIEYLDLGENSMGTDGCRALSFLLKSKNTRLKSLSLRDNDLDDDCASILSEALKSNTELQVLDLDVNDDITEDGWKHFLKLLCDDKNIECTVQSNHTLQNMGSEWTAFRRHKRKKPSRHYSFCTRDEDLYGRISELLDINESSMRESMRIKVVGSQFRDIFDLTPFLELHVTVMPYLLALMSSHGSLHKGLHHTVRNWNVTALFGSPSLDRMKIRKLEDENDKLREVVQVGQAREEILSMEVKRLKVEIATCIKKKL